MNGERTRRATWRVAIGLIALATGMVLASLAHGWVRYPGAQTHSAAGGIAFQPQVAIDSQDRARIVWTRFSGGIQRIQTTRIGANGVQGAVQDLSAAGQNAQQPQVAIDSQDRATVVWRRDDGANFRAQARRIGANGALEAVNTLSVLGEDAFDPQVAIDTQDRAQVVWRRFSADAVIDWRRISAGGIPGPEDVMSSAGADASLPQVATDSQDRTTVIWIRPVAGDPRVQLRRITADGTPSAVIQTLSAAGPNASFPQLAIDTQDRATIVWYRSDGANQRVQSRRVGPTGALEPVQTLSAPGQDAVLPQVAIDSRDRATVVWHRSDGANTRVQARRLGANGAPGPIQTLSAPGQGARLPQVAVDSEDRATVVWQRSDGINERVQARRIGADGFLGGIRTVSAAGQDAEEAQVAIDSQNRPRAAWTRFDGLVDRAQSSRGIISLLETQITAGPASNGLTGESPGFAFSGVPAADVERFECSLDGGGFAPCGSPTTLGPLTDGPHAFAVRAVDSDGADPTPDARGFTVETPPDLILSGKRKQRLRKAVKVKARCDESCVVVAKGKLKVKKRRGASRAVIAASKRKLGRSRTEIGAGETVKLKLKLKRKGRAFATRALSRGKKVRARIRAVATDGADQKGKAKRTVKLKLRSRR